MYCKFCGAELEEGVTLCAACGNENLEPAEEVQQVQTEDITEEIKTEEAADVAAEETNEAEPVEEVPQKKTWKVWQIALTAVCGVAVLAILVGAVLYGLGIDLRPRPNDVHYKESYTVEAEDAEKWVDQVVATVGDLELTNAELQAHYWMGIFETLDSYGYYMNSLGFDYTKPLDKQIYSDQEMTWQQFLLESTLYGWHQYAALAQTAEKEGYSLSDEDKEQLTAIPEDLELAAQTGGYASVDELLAAEMGPLCTQEGYIAYMTTYATALEYFDYRYQNLTPGLSEVDAYFIENEEALAESGITKESGKYYDVRHILIVPEGGITDESGVVKHSDAEWEACREKAQALLDSWKATSGDEDSFGVLAQENSADGGSATNGGLYSKLTKDTNFVEEFKAWYLDENRQVGDTGLVKSVHGYHIMYFSGSQDIWYAECLTGATGNLANAMVKQMMEEFPMEVKYKNIALGELSLG